MTFIDIKYMHKMKKDTIFSFIIKGEWDLGKLLLHHSSLIEAHF